MVADPRGEHHAWTKDASIQSPALAGVGDRKAAKRCQLCLQELLPEARPTARPVSAPCCSHAIRAEAEWHERESNSPPGQRACKAWSMRVTRPGFRYAKSEVLTRSSESSTISAHLDRAGQDAATSRLQSAGQCRHADMLSKPVRPTSPPDTHRAHFAMTFGTSPERWATVASNFPLPQSSSQQRGLP